MPKPTTLRVTDAEDGLDILIFIRQDMPVAFKLDERGKFSHQVKLVRLAITATIDYEGSESNPLYADIKTERLLTPREFYAPPPPEYVPIQRAIEQSVEATLGERVSVQFGVSVWTDITSVMGLEYSDASDETPEFTTTAIWSHAHHARGKGLLGMGDLGARSATWDES